MLKLFQGPEWGGGPEKMKLKKIGLVSVSGGRLRLKKVLRGGEKR